MKKQKKVLFFIAGTLLALTVLIAHRPGHGGGRNGASLTIVTMP